MENNKSPIRLRTISMNKWKAAFLEKGLKYQDFAIKRGISIISARDKFSCGKHITLKDLIVAQAMTSKTFDYFFEE